MDEKKEALRRPPPVINPAPSIGKFVYYKALDILKDLKTLKYFIITNRYDNNNINNKNSNNNNNNNRNNNNNNNSNNIQHNNENILYDVGEIDLTVEELLIPHIPIKIIHVKIPNQSIFWNNKNLFLSSVQAQAMTQYGAYYYMKYKQTQQEKNVCLSLILRFSMRICVYVSILLNVASMSKGYMFIG